MGWPKEDAEVILHVFEKRIPLMREIIQGHERLEGLQDRQGVLLERMTVASSTIADQWRQVAEGWKEAAKTGEVSLWEDIFLGPEFWFVVGLAAGATSAKLLMN